LKETQVLHGKLNDFVLFQARFLFSVGGPFERIWKRRKNKKIYLDSTKKQPVDLEKMLAKYRH
jgi:hypothetical protein